MLAAVDLATAHGSGHFTGSVLHARSAGDVRDILVRRYKAAWGELHNHAMPVATALALLAAGLGDHARASACSLPSAATGCGWRRCRGGLAAGVVGALVEDSGPVLLVVAVFALGCVLSYLWAPPAAADGERGEQYASVQSAITGGARRQRGHQVGEHEPAPHRGQRERRGQRGARRGRHAQTLRGAGRARPAGRAAAAPRPPASPRRRPRPAAP